MLSSEKIEELCERLTSAEDPAEIQAASAELQTAIHEHMEQLRYKLVHVPAKSFRDRLN